MDLFVFVKDDAMGYILRVFVKDDVKDDTKEQMDSHKAMTNTSIAHRGF
jgi:hypothetical protein